MLNHRLPNAPDHGQVDFEKLLAVTERLNTLLLEEGNVLSSMQMRALPPFQAEKISLSKTLDVMQQALAADDTALANANPHTRDRLFMIAEELSYTIEENMRLTAIAQAVNRRVMQTFVEVLADQQRVSVYSNQGLHGTAPDITVSLNINEQA